MHWGRRSPTGQVRARVTALREAAGAVHHAVACHGATGDDAMASVLAELGVAPWPVAPGPDAVEAALLRHARYVYERDGRVFVVASADRAFAELVDLAGVRLEVLAWERQPVAKRLQEAAHDLRRLPRPDATVAIQPVDAAVGELRAPVRGRRRSQRTLSVAVCRWSSLAAWWLVWVPGWLGSWAAAG